MQEPPVTPPSDALSVLCVEDSPDEVELVALALERADPRRRYELCRVADATGFEAALERDFDVILWGWGSDPDPNFLLSVMLTDEIPTGNSESGYSNPTYDELYLQQAVELDQQQRIDLIWEMQRIVHEDVVYIIPFYSQSVQAYRTDRFTGWQTDSGKVALEDTSSLLVIEPVR